MGLSRGGFRHDNERDLAGFETLHALAARQNAALRRKDAGDANEIARRDAGGTKRELERGQLFPVFPDALCKEHLLGNESDHAHAPCRKGPRMVNSKFLTVKELTGV